MGHAYTALRAVEAFLKGAADRGGPPGLNETLADIRAENGLGARAVPDVPHGHYEVGYHRPVPLAFPYLSIVWKGSVPDQGDMSNGAERGQVQVVILVLDANVDSRESGVGIAVALYEEAITRMMRRGSDGGRDRPRGFEGWNLNAYPGVMDAEILSKETGEANLQHNNLALSVVLQVRTQEEVD